MNNHLLRLKKNLPVVMLVILGLAIVLGLYSGLLDKLIIGNTFKKAFSYREVGDCNTFVNYVSNNPNVWLDNCNAEKTGRVPAIKYFKILQIVYSKENKKAYLQVLITRDKTYAFPYEMTKVNSDWKISTDPTNN